MSRPIEVGLSAVLVGVIESDGRAEPVVLTLPGPELPTRPFDPDRHGTLELSLRDWVETDTGHTLAHVEQLYTFGDRPQRSDPAHRVSIGYLAIVPGRERLEGQDWRPWTQFFPWEDRRAGPAPILTETLAPALESWATTPQRRERLNLSFGLSGQPWRDELVLERYELLYEAGLVEEAARDRALPPPRPLGRAMPRDDRRILATGIGRLRAKLKYRPVLFELMPETFTLFDLQTAAEAVSGQPLHKQNFRRMITQSGLIEPTGAQTARRGGRPAAEYRFAAEAQWERRVSPVRFGGARAS
ncbi:NUDIX hydrolase [Pontivivens insulae]|uniref:NrtR DNA-binding winged helix domain-containing protein n=1 Tax=Pontivivens insulae TaxID=1639689 RepID=A0A2R8A8K5_9RHOB|nr:NAD regulator [Pontivivens insulae]RED18655.1 hypothetical protein DFR53_0853 [Pontivivens insulae]SPF28553.1 hypothetical protein POI8812_00854 [Pontivivens insulae]